MLPVEGLVIAYLTFFAVVAPFTSVDRPRRIRTALVAAACALSVYIASQVLPLAVRLALPLLYIPLGYWIPVPLVPPARGGAFERWLVRTDHALRPTTVAMPRWVAETLQVGYLTCFPLVPAAFAVVWFAGSPADVARLWLAVTTAGYVCYITLPWLVSRPPRLVEDIPAGNAASLSIGRANIFVLGRVSHHLNTFPSGHVAVSIAAALTAATVSPLAGALLGILAAGVTLGAITGRYHYIVDVVLGVGIGIVAWVVSLGRGS